MQDMNVCSTFSSKVSKTDAAVFNIPGTVSVPEEDVTKNPEFCTHVSFITRIIIRGQLTTGEFPEPGCSSKASSRIIGYGPEVKRIRRNIDRFPSTRNGEGSIEVARDCDRKIKRCAAADRRQYHPTY